MRDPDYSLTELCASNHTFGMNNNKLLIITRALLFFSTTAKILLFGLD